MLKIIKKDGFASFIEVVISAIIFIIAGFGIFTAISTLSPQSKESNTRLKAAYLGKNIIEELYQNVDIGAWNDPTSPLYPGTYIRTLPGNFTVNITIVNLDSPPGVREVTLNIIYPD